MTSVRLKVQKRNGAGGSAAQTEWRRFELEDGERVAEALPFVYVTTHGRVLGRRKTKCIGYFNVKAHGELHHVHRLVATAFLPNPDGLPVVRHLNDVRDDNRVENLAWGTYQQNTVDGVRNKRFTTVLSSAIVRAARDLCREGRTTRSIASALGVREHTLAAAVRGDQWQHLRGSVPVEKRVVRTTPEDRARFVREYRRRGGECSMAELAADCGIGVETFRKAVRAAGL